MCVNDFTAFFFQKIDKLRAWGDQLCVLRSTAALNLFSLECVQVNEILTRRAYALAERVVTFFVNENRDLNKE